MVKLDEKEKLVILDATDIARILKAYIDRGYGPTHIVDALWNLCYREELEHFSNRISITNGKLITVDVS